MKKNLLSLLIFLFACLLPAATSHAAGGQAQLDVFCKTESGVIAHAQIAVYRIGDVVDSALVPDAPYNTITLPAVTADAPQAEIAAAADALRAYIEARQIAPTAVAATDAQGKAQFDALEIGTYLVLADFSASDVKDATALPALVFVLPQAAGESGPTEIFLKIEEPPEETTVPTTPTTPTRPGETTRPHTPGETTAPGKPGETTTQPATPERLPYTGQLWWPVLALAAAGVLCFVFGFVTRKHARERSR